MNFKKSVVVLSLILCVLFAISCAAASDVNETDLTTYDNQEIGDVGDDLIASSDGDLLSANASQEVSSSSTKGTFKELQTLIEEAPEGSTITLEKDYSYDEGFNKGQGVLISKNLTINGNGHTLNGMSKSRILLIMFGLENNNKVFLNDIIFKNGHTKLYGGAILNFADLTVDKCTFTNNFANTTAGAICSVGSLRCKNSVFNKNVANGDAGAIFSLNMEMSVEFFNKYLKGINTNDVVSIINKYYNGLNSTELNSVITFYKSLDTSDVAAVVNVFKSLDASDVKTIINIYKSMNGADLNSIIDFYHGLQNGDLNAILNFYKTLGPANVNALIDLYKGLDANDLNSIIKIYKAMNSVDFNSIVSFYKNLNDADLNKVIDFYKSLDVADVDKIVNFYKSLNSIDISSIADFFRNFNSIDISSIISALLNDVSLKPSTDYINKCKFTGNVATGRGGGAIYAYTHLTVYSSKFNSNRANGLGGAVYAAKNLKLRDSTFTSNNAEKYGGAVYFTFHQITGSYDKNGNWKSSVKYYTSDIQKCTFTKNIAGKRGGAIYGFKFSKKPKVAAVKAVKCKFNDNVAPQAREVYGGTLKNCVVKNTKLTMKKITLKRSSSKVVLAATLKKASSPLKNKKITFKFNNKKYTAKTNSKGVAKVTIKSSMYKKIALGRQVPYSASYNAGFYTFVDSKSATVGR